MLIDMTDDERLKLLKEMLPEAERKARHAREVMKMDGYQDMMEWVDRYTGQKLPSISALNDITGLVRQCFINDGVKVAASYWQSMLSDEEEIKTAIKEIELGDGADVDDA